MIWVDREAKKMKERGLSLEWVDDMKTPSGRIHVGSLRGVLVHDLMYKVLVQEGVKASFSYVFNDMDPMDAIPSYLDQEKWGKYAGQPLNRVPSPVEGFASFAEYYANEFIDVFNSLNCHPQIIWSHELYEAGKMNDVIRTFLDNAEKVRKIYKEVAKAERKPDWIPFNPICEKCGNIGTTNAYKWDGEYVHYRCEPNMVEWAKGCGHEGKVTPFDGHGKLPWKLDWPAHWKVIGVTIESSGKDHMSSGGSYDMATHFCREILGTEAPYAIGGYEWFTVGGRKMSSSKGIGTSAKEVTQILPPDVFRFFMVRTPITTHLDFNPYGETIPNLFDDYDRCLTAYFDRLENKIPEGKPGEVLADFARIVELSEVSKLPTKRHFLPRFRTVANILKTKGNPAEMFEKQLHRALTPEEKRMLDERIVFAKTYLEQYAKEAAPDQHEFVPNAVQKEFLTELRTLLQKNLNAGQDELQNAIFALLKSKNYKPREVFQGMYRALTGKDFGPRAAELITTIGIRQTVDALSKTNETKTSEKQAVRMYPVLDDPKIFSIDKKVLDKYPSITVGVAIIKNVSITKTNPNLKEGLSLFLKSFEGLTNETLGTYPEIQSYRKLYREMGIDWHSRRPSPEALLRRVIMKKPLYEVNTCVDAYNMVVMKHRVSVGAFDLDKIAFPTVLRFPQEGENILLLGDTEPTAYKPRELAYFDQNGGYNIDFNYRDSQRTMVTTDTKNILINIDGIYDINRGSIERSLKETIDIIREYCGGSVELAGVTA